MNTWLIRRLKDLFPGQIYFPEHDPEEFALLRLIDGIPSKCKFLYACNVQELIDILPNGAYVEVIP